MDGKDRENAGNRYKKKTVKLLLITVLVLAALAGAAFALIKTTSVFGQKAVVQQRTAVVDKGSIEEIVEGSGTVQSATRKEISPKVVSTVESANFKVGDAVKKGDLMYELDDTDALLEIEDTKNDIGQTKLTLQETVQSLEALTVKAPISGQVTEISVKADDDVNGGGSIMTIIDTSKVKVVLPFGGNIPEISEGCAADVGFQDLMGSVKGEVTYVSNKSYSLDGIMVHDVEITIDNQGALIAGMEASARITAGSSTYSSIESGTTEYVSTKAVKSDSGGKVATVNVKKNQYVNAGDVLAVLENESLKLNLNTVKLKLENLESQLAIKEKQLEYYKLAAPCNGTVLTQSVSIGDTVSAGSTLAVVADMDTLVFEIAVDELDISKIKVGQEVSVTADAVTDTLKNPLSGKVSEVSMEGTSTNGVTTYPVTVTLEKTDRLKMGMNVNGEIMISSRDDVLRVPVEAVVTTDDSSYVYVKAVPAQPGGRSSNVPGKPDGTDSSGSNTGRKSSQGQQGNGQSTASGSGNMPESSSDPYYSNTSRVKVETGISNETYIEIISGLTEGQVVALPEAGTDSEENGQQNTRNGMSGGMPGGMSGSGGGPPDGGGRPGF